MNALLWIAVLLIVIWVIAAVTKFVAGALLTLILAAGVLLLIIWAARKLF